mmetsp:Transcript_34316/g.94597  ORF Transcript_34316/g.94597 Transcript_34316/m.94597 type:complete len:399 (+) Transcript_34316:55-1251(+)
MVAVPCSPEPSGCGDLGFRTSGGCCGHVPPATVAGAKAKEATDLLVVLRGTLEAGARAAAERLGAQISGVAAGGVAGGFSEMHCSCHVGFYSNEQVICNLLHLVVQLALFSRSPPVTDGHTEPPSEEEQRQIGWKADASATAFPAAVEIEVQTERPARSQSAERGDRILGVRIGGGYHVVAQHRNAAGNARGGSRAQSCTLAERVSEYRTDPVIHSSYESHPFAHGAASDCMSATRFRVGTYSMIESDRPGPEQLYRVLKPAAHDVPAAAVGAEPPPGEAQSSDSRDMPWWTPSASSLQATREPTLCTPSASSSQANLSLSTVQSSGADAPAMPLSDTWPQRPTLLESRQSACETEPIKALLQGRLRPQSASRMRAKSASIPRGRAGPRRAAPEVGGA